MVQRLNEGLAAGRKLTLISAPAGFGKTSLLSEWVNQFKDEGRRVTDEGSAAIINPSHLPTTQVRGSFLFHPSRVAWLSLDDGDNDPTRFLTYLVAAVQTIEATIGSGVLAAIRAAGPQAPATEPILTALLNEIASLPDSFSLVLDDYHAIQAKPVDQALTFLLQHLPAQMHLVVASREDPQLPLARLRARDQLTELRAADLRFTPAEAAEFLNQVMDLNLLAEDLLALETRTEGWIAGLQLAALSMQGHPDAAQFIQSFTGSHHFVLDYLVEEVLSQQSAQLQTFLLRTSILERLCGSLCDALLLSPPASGQATLEYIEQANLFIIPLDSERRWYRYHPLFADLLRQRLAAASGEADGQRKALHIRASEWYESQGLEIDAFQHAAAAQDVERAERLIEAQGTPLYYRGAVAVVLKWLASLPATVLEASPTLSMTYASALMMTGQMAGVEKNLQVAEAALRAEHSAEADTQTRNLVGEIAGLRATAALGSYQIETMLAESRRALEYLRPDNLPYRTAAIWRLGVGHMFQGNRAAANQAYTEAITLSQASGNTFTTLLATLGLGNVHEADNRLYAAAETYRRVLQLADDPPQPVASEALLALARIHYAWNDLASAEQYGRQALQLARQFDRIIDRFVICEVFLARLKLAQGDVNGAAAILAQASQSARQHHFVHRLPEVASAQVLTLLRQGRVAAAAQLAQTHKLPVGQARVYLAQGDPSAALALLEPLRQQAETKLWADERLKLLTLQAVALQAQGETDQALPVLADALALAEPGGFIRIFVDEGLPMARLLSQAVARGLMPDYVSQLLAAYPAETQMGATVPPAGPRQSEDKLDRPPAQPPAEPLSPRELEVLQLMAQGLSNHEIAQRLFLALNTVKGHNRNIFGKLQVQRRTEAVARARDWGLL